MRDLAIVIATSAACVVALSSPASAAPERGANTVTVELRTAVAQLPVHPRSHEAVYDRSSDFGDWIDQGHGCDTRAVVLKDESTRPTTQNSNCTIETGRWASLYNGRTYTAASSLQVDHVVPVENAWASGAWHWTQATRVAYYNDLGDPRTLLAVDEHDNEAKGDDSPDQWMPTKGRCTYIDDFVAVKIRWHLTVTQPEETALAGFAARCANVTLHVTTATIHSS